MSRYVIILLKCYKEFIYQCDLPSIRVNHIIADDARSEYGFSGIISVSGLKEEKLGSPYAENFDYL